MKVVITGLLLAACATSAMANDNGKAGRTSRLGEGCGDCHGINASSATTVSMSGITGPVTMTPGSSREFTVVVAHSSMPVAGVDISVRDAADNGAIVGTIAAGTNVQIKGKTGELTHAAPVTMTAGQAQFTFTWTAPTTPGTYYVQAIGNACDGDGVETDADQWSWMTPVEIVVSSTSDVSDVAGSAGPSIAPNPAFSGASAQLIGLPSDITRLRIIGIDGGLVFEQPIVPIDADQPIDLPALPSGSYRVIITSSRSVRAIPLTVVR